MKIMFICTGNICRSAMAEAMLKKMVEQEKIPNIEVCSSGIYAETGDVSTIDAIEVMEEYGINLKEHRATNTKESQVEAMDLILCATLSHKIAVLQAYPDLKEKVYTIKEYAGLAKEGKGYDIADPWGCSIVTYRKCAAEIEDCLKEIVKKIQIH